MLFNSLEYLFFIVLLFVAYYLIFPTKWKWILLLASSIYFYYSWNGLFLIIVGISITIDYVIGISLSTSTVASKRKWLLLLSIITNIGLLVTFKYYDFFVSNLNYFLKFLELDYVLSTLSLPFPVGISFYTFQTLSYTIDIYKGYRDPERNIGKFSLFVLFFPQLLAGPIERSRKLLPQLNLLPAFNYESVVGGMRLILWGLFKKMVVADRIGEYIDRVYNSPVEFQGVPLILGSCLFTIQIFCDFSGYTDMAIGSAKIFGINLSKNFENRSYFASSYTNFWKGWHITLTAWFRDYLFFAIVGKSRSTITFYSSLIFVFIITGLWHGAGWGFILWGLFHGFWVAGERLTYTNRMLLFGKLGLLTRPKLLFFLAATFMFLLGSFFSVWFRAESITMSLEILKWSFKFDSQNIFTSIVNQDMLIIIFNFCLMDIINWKMKQRNFNEYMVGLPIFKRWFLYILIVELVLMFGEFNSVNFYYFRF